MRLPTDCRLERWSMEDQAEANFDRGRNRVFLPEVLAGGPFSRVR